MPKDQPIIIKKSKKRRGHGGHHGGAWKVAYADFVTAMMAFFMVLWLVAMLSIDTKDAMAVYFRSYSIFEGSEKMGGAGKGIISVLQGSPVQLDEREGDIRSGDSYRNLELQLGGVLESELGALRDQVLMVVTKDGIRIELVEKYGSPMFGGGNAVLLESGETILWVLAQALETSNALISIEGHTDSSPSSRVDYSNWELAADRANSARRALIEGGFDEERITRVTSFADSAPFNAKDPYDPMNRRVSILIVN
jgi:chemotaxis protein MotB